jgi:hypothetical protein
MHGWAFGRLWRTVVALVLASAAFGAPAPAFGGSSGANALFTLQGSDAGLSNGDFVSDSDSPALHSHASFFIEVPKSLTRLVVEIFDPDIGRGGGVEDRAGRDRARNVSFGTTATYTLLRPDGTTAATLANCNATTCEDNAWQAILDSNTTQNTVPGHWELRVQMGTGDDINAFGVRAHDGAAGGAGAELPVYVGSLAGLGVNPPASGTASRSYTLYPYITSGCSASENDFDYDSNEGDIGSISLTSADGGFTKTFGASALSKDSQWIRNTFTGWTNGDSDVTGYGIWTANLTTRSYAVSAVPNGNYASLYFADSEAAANPPRTAIPPQAFRLYLPGDAGAAPVKPYLNQYLRYDSGPNPPQVGRPTRVWVIVQIVNPTPYPLTFSSANLVTTNAPGRNAIYAGHAEVAQGTIVSQPAIGGTGNITWNPGSVLGGQRDAILTYAIDVFPTSAGQRITTTGTVASGNGTRARFVDETGNTTQARSTFTLGPLCELAATAGLLISQATQLPFLPTGPTSLRFPSTPSGVTLATPFGTVVQVRRRAVGFATVVDAAYSGPVTLSLETNPTGATLGGTTTVNAVNGVATFTFLTLSQQGSGYQLKASTSAPSLSATSSPFSTGQLSLITPGHVGASEPGCPGILVADTEAGATTAQVATDAACPSPVTLRFDDGEANQEEVSVVGEQIVDQSPAPGGEAGSTGHQSILTLGASLRFAHSAGEAVYLVVAAEPVPSPDPRPDQDDSPRKQTEEQRQQRQRTNRSGLDDYRTEGNVAEVHQDEQPPYVVIGNKDGLVRVNLLCGNQCPKVQVGDYLEAEGEKQHEQLYDATDVTVKHVR